MNSFLYRSAPVASALCAAHCLAAPLLVSVAPVATTPGVEWGLLLLAGAVSATVLRSGFRAHSRTAPAAIAAACLALWAAVLGGWVPDVPAEAVTFVASIGVAAATYWSGRLRHAATCESCACPAHRAESAPRA